jgi:exopolysaccharide biosynthesis polyprenyl glycosylphosphotransferase
MLIPRRRSIPRRRKRDSFLPWAQLIVDLAAIYILLFVVFWFRFESGFFTSSLGAADYPVYYRVFHLIALVLIVFLRFYGLYKPARFLTFAAETAKTVKAVAVSTLILTALTFFIRGFSFSRSFLVVAGAALAVTLPIVRFFLGLLVMWVDERRGSWRNVLVVGTNANGRRLVSFYRSNPRFSTRVMGFLDEKIAPGVLVEGMPVLGRIDDLGACLKQHGQIHEVIVAEQSLSNEKILWIISECEKVLVEFRLIADLFGLIASKMSVSYRGSVPLLSFTDSPLSDWENRFLKRSMDICLSAAALFTLSPVFAVLAFLVKGSSPGPVFYKQERVGEDGRHLALYKFRTMRIGAEKKSGPVWATANDSRRTPLGGFLRKTSLDELPQLWNVLKGDMSLVGPRPERPFFVSQFKEDIPRYMARHTIRSGLTGWAQVNGFRGDTSIEERTKYDLFYIENWTLLLDIKILFMTVFTLFKSRNAY